MKTITIDPITRLEGHGKITIFLNDDGSVANVYFQVPDEGYFTNSLVQYSDNHGVYALYAVVNLNNSTFNDNGGDGIYAYGTSELQINNCAFNNNDGYAARLSGINLTTYTNNSGSGNNINAFGIAGSINQNIGLYYNRI